jgi:hypothetical protein
VVHITRFTTRRIALCLGLTSLLAAGAVADSTTARCDIYPAGEDTASASVNCRFYQAQGHVVITREDGPEYDLTPVESDYGRYVDQHGSPVIREHGLGEQGLIFRLPDESVFVYWAPLRQDRCDRDKNATWPYCTSDYDATTLLRCRSVGDVDWGTCPAGVLRMDDGQASVVISSPAGDEVTINFMRDYVNAANRSVEADRASDPWIVVVDGEVEYQVPRAAIEGG